MTQWAITFLSITILCSTTLHGQSDTIAIKAGLGIDNIIIRKSSETTLRNYKNEKFTKDRGTGIACGTYGSRRDRWIKYQSKSIGLTFELRTSLARWPFQIFHKIRLEKIIVTKTAKTIDGLIVGKSDRLDVMALYGQQPDWRDARYISYTNKGIAFRFNDGGTIVEIEIFVPYDSKSDF